MLARLFLVFVVLLVFSAPASMDVNNLILQSSFENEADFTNWQKETCRLGSLTISTEVARTGNASARFELSKADVTDFKNFVRSELRLNSEKDKERWYGFCNYLPIDFIADPLAEKIAQWHEVPDWDLGEGWRSPPISLGIINDRFYVQVLWAAAAVNTNRTKDGEKTIDLGYAEKNKWIDWVFHIKFSYRNDGIIEIWKNGLKVLSYTGPNSYNDENYPYFKIGLYKWGWDGWASYSPEDKRVIFFDEVKIGDRHANMEKVSPQ